MISAGMRSAGGFMIDILNLIISFLIGVKDTQFFLWLVSAQILVVLSYWFKKFIGG